MDLAEDDYGARNAKSRDTYPLFVAAFLVTQKVGTHTHFVGGAQTSQDTKGTCTHLLGIRNKGKQSLITKKFKFAIWVIGCISPGPVT
jgi:hypothetical protein